jgi:hypothetical protein
VALCLLLTACVEPFDPPVNESDVGFLVIDGYVNTKTHAATVRLSRAIPIAESEANPKVSGGIVKITDSSGNQYLLAETQPGVYSIADNGLVTEKTYRLSVATGGNTYLSNVISPKASPPIDEVTWSPKSDGINITASTNDPSRSTTYYRWEFSETWEYQSALSSESRFVNGVPVLRTAAELVKTCYTTKQSTTILTGTTIDLTEDRITNFKVSFIPKGNEKLKYRYSILVMQYALSKEAYEYWQQLKSNTEDLGGLFDPQPSRIKGNLYNESDPREPVIGYFDGGEISEKRIFIKREDLPDHLSTFPQSSDCVELSIPAARVRELTGSYLITSAVYDNLTIVAYLYTIPTCADCTLFGGITQKPGFWPY